MNCLRPVIIFNPAVERHIYHCSQYMINGVVYQLNRYILDDVYENFSWWRVIKFPFPSQLSVEFIDNYGFIDSDGVFTPAYLQVACGHCDACLEKYQNSLVQRCQFQIAQDQVSPFFVTLTYNDKYLPVGGKLCKEDVQKFKKRFNQTCSRMFKNEPFHLSWVVTGEYGDPDNGSRPHYHMLLMGCPKFSDSDKENHIKTIQALYYSWRDNKIHSDERKKLQHQYADVCLSEYMTFRDYCRLYPRVFCRPADYDPYSFGYINFEYPRDISKCAGYITKYITKQRNEFRPMISINLGVDFVQKNLNVNDYAKTSVMNVNLFGKVTEVSLCQYYIKKFFPNFSDIFPCQTRRAFEELNFCYNEVLAKYWKKLDHEEQKTFINTKNFLTDKFSVLPFYVALYDPVSSPEQLDLVVDFDLFGNMKCHTADFADCLERYYKRAFELYYFKIPDDYKTLLLNYDRLITTYMAKYHDGINAGREYHKKQKEYEKTKRL